MRLLYNLVLLAILFFTSPALAVDVSTNPLIQKALSKKLHTTLKWKALLHYAPPKRLRLQETFSNTKLISEVDAPEFFIAEDGKVNPEAELIATIQRMFIEQNKEIISRFPARFKWLHKELQIEDMPYDKFFIGDYKHLWENRAEFTSVVFVFASEYINQPQSAFGHSMILLKRKNYSGAIGVTINYAADYSGSNYFEFIFKGICGGFEGKYQSMPYYQKIQEYTYYESRDLWEYTLDFSQEDIEIILDHIWELENGNSKYFFFTENCSYNILHLIDVARPELELCKKQNRPWVIPSDTLKSIKDRGLIKSSKFRPSINSRLYPIAKAMNAKQIEIAIQVASDEIRPESVLHMDEFEEQEKAEILDFALEYYQLKHFPKTGSEQTNSYNAEIIRRSRPRSTLRGPNYHEPVKEDPAESHNSFLIETGAGHMYDQDFVYLRFQPAYHNITDRSYGFAFGNSMVIGDTRLHKYLKPNENFLTPEIHLEKLTLLRLSRIKTWTQHFKDLSWMGEAGLDKNRPENNKLGFFTQFSTGLCFELFPNFYFVSMPGSYSTYKNDINFSVQYTNMIMFNHSKYMRTSLEAKNRKYFLGHRSLIHSALGELSLFPSQNSTITGSIEAFLDGRIIHYNYTAGAGYYF